MKQVIFMTKKKLNILYFLYAFWWITEILQWNKQWNLNEIEVATSENTDCDVHEWNKIQCYTEKKKKKKRLNFLFLLCFYLQ